MTGLGRKYIELEFRNHQHINEFTAFAKEADTVSTEEDKRESLAAKFVSRLLPEKSDNRKKLILHQWHKVVVDKKKTAKQDLVAQKFVKEKQERKSLSDTLNNQRMDAQRDLAL